MSRLFLYLFLFRRISLPHIILQTFPLSIHICTCVYKGRCPQTHTSRHTLRCSGRLLQKCVLHGCWFICQRNSLPRECLALYAYWILFLNVFHYIYANLTWLAHNLLNASICQGYFQSLRKMCLCVFWLFKAILFPLCVCAARTAWLSLLRKWECS